MASYLAGCGDYFKLDHSAADEPVRADNMNSQAMTDERDTAYGLLRSVISAQHELAQTESPGTPTCHH